jgi:hypothetical protein
MSAIVAKFFANGFHITIADDLTPAWDREFLISATCVRPIGHIRTD